MKYMAIIDSDEKPVSCEFIGCNGNVAPYLIGATTNIKALEQQPCEDAISRESVIEWLKDKDIIKTKNQEENARRELAELPSITPSYNSIKTELKQQTRWIPVSERMPEEFICDDGYVEPSDYVLVWGDHGNYGVSRYWGNRKTKTENPNSYKDWMDLD